MCLCVAWGFSCGYLYIYGLSNDFFNDKLIIYLSRSFLNLLFLFISKAAYSEMFLLYMLIFFYKFLTCLLASNFGSSVYILFKLWFSSLACISACKLVIIFASVYFSHPANISFNHWWVPMIQPESSLLDLFLPFIVCFQWTWQGILWLHKLLILTHIFLSDL